MSGAWQDLRARVQELETLNTGLSLQLVSMSDRLQASARLIAAQAWDAGHKAKPGESNPFIERPAVSTVLGEHEYFAGPINTTNGELCRVCGHTKAEH